MLKVFDLTLVLYDSESPLLTLSLGVFALSPFMILVGLMTLLLVSKLTRTWFHVSLLSGLCVSHLINSLLKRMIRGARPVNPWLEDLASKQCFAYGNVSSVGYGMPSAHAQFMFFFCAFVLIPKYVMSDTKKKPANGSKRQVWYLSFDPIIVLWSILVCISRVFHMYHTTGQVLLGAVVGTVLALVWRFVTLSHLVTAIPVVASLRNKVCQWFDITLEEETEKKEQ